MTLVWLSFILAVAVLLIVGRKSIWLALFISAFIIGIFNIPLIAIGEEFINTISDLPVILLALAVGIIPLIGGVLEETGLTEELVKNLRIGKRWFVTLTPALLGALPMPGGALLSAPILNRGAKELTPEVKVALNVWFRHLPLLVYPLGAVLVTTRMANLPLYTVILYISPWLILMLGLGFAFFLLKVKGKVDGTGAVKYSGIFKPVIGIFLAPFVHLMLTSIFPDLMPELPLLLGVACSLSLVLYFGKPGLVGVKDIFKKMKPWKFFLIIIGMFLFLNIFKRSGTSKIIADVIISKTFFIVLIAVFLGFVTGRVQVPVSIMLPIFYAKYGREAMDPLTFSIMYVAIFMGYVLSPVHPCVSVSLEYFRSDLKTYFKSVALPSVIIIVCLFVVSSIIF